MRLGIGLLPFILIAFLAASYMWWSHGHYLEKSTPTVVVRRWPPDVERWLEVGLLSKEQAEAIGAFEESQILPRKIPLFAEALGYLGAIFAIAGGGVAVGQVWEDLSDAVRVGILAASTVATLGAGALVRPQSEPAMRRLTSVLWTISVVALVGTLVLTFVDVVELTDDALPLAIGGITSVYAAILWFFHRQVLQQAALFGTGMAAVQGALLMFPGEAGAWAYALIGWGYGVGWFALGWYGSMAPVWAALPLGAIAAMWAPSVAVDEYGWLYVVALVSAAALITLSITSRKLPLLAIGGVFSFIYLTSSVVRYFGDTLGVPLALAMVGAIVLAIAVAVGRTSAVGGQGWHSSAGHPT